MGIEPRVNAKNAMDLRPEAPIGPATSLEAAVRAFHESVNKPGTMFSTENWIQPKLSRLRALLADPISDDQAQAFVLCALRVTG